MEKKLTGLNAAMYLRKSRAEDGMDTDEILRRHRETLTEYAAVNGIHVSETFPEVRSGESLYTRPEMLRLLEAVESGQFEAVLCMDLDRLSRGGTRDRGLIWETLKEAGTLIVTPSKTYDLSEESDEMLVEFGGLIASMELKQIKKRLRRGKERALREGSHIAHPPYGYRRTTVDRRPTLEIYEPEARFVRMIFDWYGQGIGCTVIAQRLNDLGARPHRASVFTRVTILKMIKNPVYIGKVVWNQTHWKRKTGKIEVTPVPPEEWIQADGVHPAIVSADLFQRCQDILAGRYKPPTFDGSVKSPLVGLLYCGKCGGHMQRQPRRGVDYVRCLKNGCCAGSRQDFVENAVLIGLENILEELKPPEQTVNHAETIEQELNEIVAAIQQIESKKALLYDLLEDGTYTRQDFTSRMERIRDRLSALERDRTETLARLEAARKADKDAQSRRIQSALEEYPQADPARKNAILRQVVEKIVYRKEKGAKPAEFSLKIIPKF